MNRLKKSTLLVALWLCTTVAGFGQMVVYDGARHMTDLMDNVVELLEWAESIEGTYMTVKGTYEQLKQMESAADIFGKAGMFQYDTDTFEIKKLRRDLSRSSSLIKRAAKSTDKTIIYFDDLYDRIDEKVHKIFSAKKGPYEKYHLEKMSRNELLKTMEKVRKQMDEHQKEIQSLTEALNEAETDQEIQKIKGMLIGHQVQVTILRVAVNDIKTLVEHHDKEMKMRERMEETSRIERMKLHYENVKTWDLKRGNRTIRDNSRNLMKVKFK